MLTDAQWVAVNLPARVSFSKNGVTVTVDQMIADALARAATDTRVVSGRVKEMALSYLFTQLHANVPYAREKAKHYEREKSQYAAMANHWEAYAIGGAIMSVAAAFTQDADAQAETDFINGVWP